MKPLRERSDGVGTGRIGGISSSFHAHGQGFRSIVLCIRMQPVRCWLATGTHFLFWSSDWRTVFVWIPSTPFLSFALSLSLSASASAAAAVTAMKSFASSLDVRQCVTSVSFLIREMLLLSLQISFSPIASTASIKWISSWRRWLSSSMSVWCV